VRDHRRAYGREPARGSLDLTESAVVQVFGRRNAKIIHALWRPASENLHKRRSGAFRARSAKPTIPSLDHGAVDEVLEQMPALHAGRGTLCQLDGDQFFFGVYGEAGSEYAAPHCIAL